MDNFRLHYDFEGGTSTNNLGQINLGVEQEGQLKKLHPEFTPPKLKSWNRHWHYDIILY